MQSWTLCAASDGGLLASPRSSGQNEHDTDDSSEDQDAQSDLHPDSEVADCRLDPVPPRIRNVSTTLRQPAFEFKLGFLAFGLAG